MVQLLFIKGWLVKQWRLYILPIGVACIGLYLGFLRWKLKRLTKKVVKYGEISAVNKSILGANIKKVEMELKMKDEQVNLAGRFPKRKKNVRVKKVKGTKLKAFLPLVVITLLATGCIKSQVKQDMSDALRSLDASITQCPTQPEFKFPLLETTVVFTYPQSDNGTEEEVPYKMLSEADFVALDEYILGMERCAVLLLVDIETRSKLVREVTK